MSPTQWLRCALLVFVFASPSPVALAETVRSRSGVQLDLPAGWVVATDMEGRVRDDIIQQHKVLEPYAGLDCELFVFDPSGSDSAATFLMVGIQAGMDEAIDEQFLAKTKDITFAVAEGPGARVLNEAHRLEEIGGRRVFVVDATIRLGEIDLCQVAFLLREQGLTYMFMCSAPLTDKSQAVPVFEAMIGSFAVYQNGGGLNGDATNTNYSADSDQNTDGDSILMIVLIVVGSLLALLAGVIVYATVSAKKKAKARALKRAERARRG